LYALPIWPFFICCCFLDFTTCPLWQLRFHSECGHKNSSFGSCTILKFWNYFINQL
jgi:hypothetical protein